MPWWTGAIEITFLRSCRDVFAGFVRVPERTVRGEGSGTGVFLAFG